MKSRIEFQDNSSLLVKETASEIRQLIHGAGTARVPLIEVHSDQPVWVNADDIRCFSATE